jgi:UDPglucose 6-dehydrogenase
MVNIVIFGAGYVGLVSGACFADFGHTVTCVDLDAGKIERLQRGEIPIFEPGLDQIVAQNMREGRLSFSTDPSAVAQADAVFIAVGTPSRRGDGHADLSYVYGAAEQIADLMQGYTVVVTKSTVPVGTGDEVETIIRKRRPDTEFAVVSNPEFLREGAAINDFKRPDRVVVGGAEDPRAANVMKDLYRPLFLNETPILFMSRRTSELTKYAGNAFLAMKITFINEVADLCEKVGANVQDVARGIGLDNRIGRKFLNAGPGYGGSCFPKDTLALVRTAQDAGAPLELVETTVRKNAARKQAMAHKVIDAMGGDVAGKTIAILGLTFKPNTDDMRDAPSLDIIPALQAEGAVIKAFDPEGMHEAEKVLKGVQFMDGPYQVLDGADGVVLITEWDQFRALDLKRMRSLLRAPVMVDLRNIYRSTEMEEAGFVYRSVGRPAPNLSEGLS